MMEIKLATMQTQEIEFKGEYSISLSSLPITISKKGVPVLLILAMYFSSMIAVVLLTLALEIYSSTDIIKECIYYSLFFIFLCLVFVRNENITIEQNKISYKKTLAMFIPIAKWNAPMSSYNALLGKRYYSRLDGKVPLLVREVILHNNKNPIKFNVILARFVDRPDKYILCQDLWTEYWYQACIFFEKIPINLVDNKKEKIDVAEIKFIEGDGGAVQY